MKEKWSPAEVVLLCALAAVVCVHHYFFILLPHNGALRLMRIALFMNAALSLCGLVVFLKAFARERVQILFALLLVVANFSFRELLTAPTVLEATAPTFFIWSLAFYSGDRFRWLALFLFPLVLFSQASFVVLCAVYAVMEYYRRKPNWVLPVVLAIEAIAFAVLVKHSSAGLSASHLVTGIKSYGPALGFFIFAGFRSPGSKALFWVGVCALVSSQAFAPFGWAMVFAAVVSAPVFTSRVGIALLACTFLYQVTSAVKVASALVFGVNA